MRSKCPTGGSVLEALGGETGCRKLAAAFYANVAKDLTLRPLFPGKSMRCQIEEFSAFLVQFLDGDEKSSQYRWWLSLRESHARFRITGEHRTAWLHQMESTLQSSSVPEATKNALHQFFTASSANLLGEQGGEVAEPELAARWAEVRALDTLIGQIDSARDEQALADFQRFKARPSVFVGVLARMLKTGRPALVRAVAHEIQQDPPLGRHFYAGRTLLHNAAGAGRADIVSLLLNLGMDPNALDQGSHPPLYTVANECGGEEGPQIVRMLVAAGAEVDMAKGVVRTTPLHMAARRGHVEIARALLDAGAFIHARDRKGCTPLDRALNCGKAEVARLLQAKAVGIPT